MLMLGFDTATEMCTVAVGTEEQTLACIDLVAPRAHLEKLLPLAEQALHMCGRAQSDVEAIAVGIGPGSLTGVRIGVATARTLAQALEVPCVGVSTLDVVAHAFSATGATVCAMLDAKRKEVYPALYDCSGQHPKRLTEFRATRPEALCEELASHEDKVLLAGNGLEPYAELMTKRLGDKVATARREAWYPSGSRLVDLAHAMLEEGGTDFREVRPIYVRLSDAEESRAAKR